jgi:hypothetical protein
MGRLIEGLWDCTQCGTKGIGGSQRDCPTCGRARGKDVKFYLPETRSYNYVPDEEASKISRRPNWKCNYCDSLNPDEKTSCQSCGVRRTHENLNYFEIKREEEPAKSAGIVGIKTNQRRQEVRTIEFEPQRKSNRDIKGMLRIASLVLIIAVCILGLTYLLIPKEKEIIITQTAWNRSINIERYQTVDESDWSLPVGARLKYQQQEFSHYEKVLEGYETKTRPVTKQRFSGYTTRSAGVRDLGNGYFEEITVQEPVYETYTEMETYQEPVYSDRAVYRTKYYYEIDKWLYERSVTTRGQDKNPYWGEVVLNKDERTSTRSEEYYVMGIDKEEKEHKISLSYNQWEHINVGEKRKFKVSIFGNGELVMEEGLD